MEIRDFIIHLTKWQETAAEANAYFMPKTTYIVLKVTLTAIPELFSFMVEKHSYSFLMIAHLNQDSLEVYLNVLINRFSLIQFFFYVTYCFFVF